MDDDILSSATSNRTSNSTSTFQYSHEPYETYQWKIVPLAHSLGNFETVSLDKTPGGSYNRVVTARLKRGHETVRGIFRVPRFTSAPQDNTSEMGRKIDSEIHNHAAVLMHLTRHNIAAPRLLAFDASATNHIGSPSVFLEFSTGTILDKLYGGMSLQQKLDVADSFAEFLFSAESTNFSKIGTIGAQKSFSTPPEWSSFTDAVRPDIGVEVMAFNGGDAEPSQPARLSFPNYLAQQLQYWHQKHGDPGSWGKVVDQMWTRLVQNLHQMQQLGFFTSPGGEDDVSTADSILQHSDLEPWNIIARPKQAKANGAPRWEIDKVIDWDSPRAVPPVLAREPPAWLWELDNGELNWDDQQVIKEQFEKTFVRKLGGLYTGYNKATYLDEVYGRGVWVRRIARFAIHGPEENFEERCKQFDKEWLEEFGDLD